MRHRDGRAYREPAPMLGSAAARNRDAGDDSGNAIEHRSQPFDPYGRRWRPRRQLDLILDRGLTIYSAPKRAKLRGLLKWFAAREGHPFDTGTGKNPLSNFRRWPVAAAVECVARLIAAAAATQIASLKPYHCPLSRTIVSLHPYFCQTGSIVLPINHHHHACKRLGHSQPGPWCPSR